MIARRWQRGLGAFGTLVILVIAAVAGYYVYKEVFMQPEGPPSCKAALNRCIANCRKTTSEAPANQACQESCQRDSDACERKR